ncbi:hypothetical protein A3I58_00515 [Candidatus Peregrinibacteria bacterium RIFCSPLOWO2_02_FULL_39_10]|nr:MAG: hypothetical protein A3I58_00515 [Candidatus Peregrinibacteria bacterium RIFCSPLOWO2_02_FULL_39_10]
MWTYFLIFLSVIVLAVIFVRRWVLFCRKGLREDNLAKAPNDGSAEDSVCGDEDIIQKISRSDREKVDALYRRGVSMLEAGKDDEAIKCFVQALSIDAVHTETMHKLAMLYLQKQMYGVAAVLFKQLGEITSDPVHYSHLGLVLYQQSDFEASKEAYQQAVKLDANRPQRFVSLAQVYRALGQINHAMMALNKALEVDKGNIEFLFLLATLQAESGDFGGAKGVIEKILEFDPSNKEAKDFLKELRAKPTEG